MKICPSCGESNAERARFCQACGTALPESVAVAGEIRKVVTIVFADVAGSTGIGEALDPEALRRVQARFFDAMTVAIEAHGGIVEKYIGDAVMAVFGIPRLHEDDALRAVRAAVAMRAALADLNDRLERDHGVRIDIRVGVHTGEVVAGDPSAGQRLVTGDAVNTAARLEQAAGPGEILIGASTYRLVRDAVEVDEVEPLELRGKSERVPAYRLREVLADSDGHARHLDSPMVGREKELELVRRGLERARDERTSYLFTLLGSAGVGKSRLVREFLAGVEDATIVRGRCLSYGDGITYYAMGEIAHQAAGIAETDDPATALRKLETLLAGADDGERIARLVGGLFGLADPSGAEDAAWAVRKLLEHLARDRPVVVVIDDIHWAEPLLLDLIEYLADWTRDAMVLILCVARPELLELRPGWGGGKMNATTILLEPLAGDEAGALLGNLLGGTELPAIARDRILAAAEGNPLFVEEMIGMLIDDGLLRDEDGTWRAVSDLADLTVPPTIHLLLAARLDRLEAEERAVIERGAVEGKVFHTGAVTSLAPESLRSQVRPRLLALARKELIRPDRAEFAGEDAFRFRHMLIRDAAYQAMSKEQRAELHEAFAQWLTGVTGGRETDYGEIRGYHLDQAYRYRVDIGPIDDRTRELGREAGRALMASSDRLHVRGDLAGAIRVLERAVDLLDGEEHVEALLQLGEKLLWNNEDKRVLALLAEPPGSIEVAERPGSRIRAALYVEFARASTDPTRSQADARELAGRLLAEAEAIGDDVAIITCLLGVGQWAFWTGRCSEQRAISMRLLPQLDRLRPIERDWAAAGLRTAAYWGPTPVEEGFEDVERMRILAGDSVHGELAADCVNVALLEMADRREEAERHADRWISMVTDVLGDASPVGRQVIADVLWRLGRREQAIEIMSNDVAFWDARGETGINSTSSGQLARYLAACGRIDEAEPMIAKARALAAADDFATAVEIGRSEAIVALTRGQAGEALAAVDAALVRLEPTDYAVMTAEVFALRGRALLALGRAADAKDAFDAARALHRAKGDVSGVRRLDELIAAEGAVR